MKKVYQFLLGAAAMFCTMPAFADDAAAAPKENNLMQTLIMIAVALVFFYFILWRPEQKRRKQMDQLRTSLKKGDRITAMGIIGTVVKVQDNTVILAMYDGAKIEVLKAAITDVQPAASEERSEKAALEPTETR